MNDPAFLFYSNDFLSGTMFFSDEQTGRYIRALCAQHQHGHLKPAQLNAIIKNDALVQEKFVRDPDGLFYNERLEEEINKRIRYTDSQRQRVLKRWNKTPAISDTAQNASASDTVNMQDTDNPLNENENENERYYRTDTTVLPRNKPETSEERAPAHGKKARSSKPFKPPTLEEVAAYCAERKNGIDPHRFIDHYSIGGWVYGKNKTPIKDWKACIRTWEARNGISTGGKGRFAGAGTGSRTTAAAGLSRNSAENRRRYAGRAGYDENGNPIGAVARPGEFDEGVLTLEGVKS